MAKKAQSSGSLDSLSIAELQAEIRRRTGTLASLQRKRERAAKKLAEIDALIAQHGGSVRGAGTRASNAISLVDAMQKVLRGKTMGVSEVADAVRASGYVTTSPNFRVIVNQTFIKHKKIFKRIGRGQYTVS
jgi:hypothetical protein